MHQEYRPGDLIAAWGSAQGVNRGGWTDQDVSPDLGSLITGGEGWLLALIKGRSNRMAVAHMDGDARRRGWAAALRLVSARDRRESQGGGGWDGGRNEELLTAELLATRMLESGAVMVPPRHTGRDCECDRIQPHNPHGYLWSDLWSDMGG